MFGDSDQLSPADLHDESRRLGALLGQILSLNVIAHAGDFNCEVTDDNWTAVSRDRRRSVQFGQMVIVTDGPAAIVTPERTHT